MNTKAELFVDSRCELGEGPFWHPLLERLFWFDILNQTMARVASTAKGIITKPTSGSVNRLPSTPSGEVCWKW